MKWSTIVLLLAVVVGLYYYFTQEEPFDPWSVSGLRVLVTGASSGIGEQIAYQYARHRASVFITARRQELLEKVIAKCEELGSEEAIFGYLPADLRDDKNPEKIIQEAVSTLGGLDHLILNHAHIPMPRAWDASPQNVEDLNMALDVTVKSTLLLTAYALPQLEKVSGNIGFVNSLLGKITIPFFGPYSTAKFGLDGFFNTLRMEVASRGISITNCVLGSIDTELNKRLVEVVLAHMGVDEEDAADRSTFTANSTDCAWAILRGTTLRHREIYFPAEQYIKYFVWFREILNKLDLTVIKSEALTDAKE